MRFPDTKARVTSKSDWSISQSLSSHWSMSLTWLLIGPFPADIIVLSSWIVGVRAAAREELFKRIINRPGVATLPQVREYKEY